MTSSAVRARMAVRGLVSDDNKRKDVVGHVSQSSGGPLEDGIPGGDRVRDSLMSIWDVMSQ